jgi:hypothetical protein
MKPISACGLGNKAAFTLWLFLSSCSSQYSDYKPAYTAADHEEVARQLERATTEATNNANKYQALLEATERTVDDGKLPYELGESYRDLVVHYQSTAINSAKMAVLHRDIAALIRKMNLNSSRMPKTGASSSQRPVVPK